MIEALVVFALTVGVLYGIFWLVERAGQSLLELWRTRT
jgi:hypothetical protein